MNTRTAIHVCVCGATSPEALIFINRLAAGDLLGIEQPMKITLQDKPQQLEELCFLANDLQDSCYPLLVGPVKTETSLLPCLENADVIVLLMPTRDAARTEQTLLEETIAATQDYAIEMNHITNLGHRIVLMAGQKAVVAAGVLTTLSPHLCRHQILAIDLPGALSHHKQKGGYHLAQIVCECFQPWWTGKQETKTTILGVSFHRIPRVPLSCFLPMPLHMLGPHEAEISPTVPPNWIQIGSVMQDFTQAIKMLGITLTSSQHNSSFSKL